MDLRSGFCPVCKQLLIETVVYGAVYEDCLSCGYARLVGETEERPWRR